jgi:hypothetical protein
MNIMMNHIEAYSNILRIRSKFKRLQQLSWNINKLEKQYQIDDMDPKDLVYLYDTYASYIKELEIIYDELKDEREQRLDITS